MRKYGSTVLISLLCSLLCVAIYHAAFYNPPSSNKESFARFANDNTSQYNLKPSFVPPVDDMKFIDIVNESKFAVVSVKAVKIKESGFFRDKYSKSNGSGVILSPDGFIVTNYHVVEDASDIEIKLEDKREYKAKLIGYDLSTDIALLKIESNNLQYLEFGNSDSLQVGEWVLAIGNPFKLQSSVTAGIVSAKARNINLFNRQGIESFIQTDAAINPGNSGGALLNTRGELVGVNTAILTYSGKYEGFSFAVPGNLVQKVVSDIREYGAVQRAWLGISIFDVDEQQARKLDLDFIGGVYLDVVEKDGSAHASGLRSKDVITSIDGSPTMTTPEFLETMGKYSPGDEVNIEFYRNGTKQSCKAILRNQLNTTDFVAVRKDEILLDLGFELRELNSDEIDRLDKEGILVVSIFRNSTIAKTNMDPGYIITTINGNEVTTVNQLI
ncbi:MAG: trypsin-like peptidase domain-containing protein, partial [Bacteroidia bacterium]|nr:trypsin-like peptidase domain-containing protein [Bacteroidia bacterium]